MENLLVEQCQKIRDQLERAEKEPNLFIRLQILTE